MASALVDMNRLPLRRTGMLDVNPLKSTLMPCVPPLIDEVVTEIGVFTALMPSAAFGPMLLPDTTRPKTDDPDVDVAPLVIRMPVDAYRTAALTNAPLALPPARTMPPQSPGCGGGWTVPVHPITTAERHVATPTESSVRLLKTFWRLLGAVSSAWRLTPCNLRTPPLPTFTMSPAFTVRMWGDCIVSVLSRM